MRIPLIALGVLLAAGCNAPNNDTAAPSTPDAQRPASAPTPQPEPQSPEDSSTTATVPEQFRGAYAADASACTSPGHVTQLDIGASTIGFHESSGDVISVDSRGNDVGITAELTGGSFGPEASIFAVVVDAAMVLLLWRWKPAESIDRTLDACPST